MMLGENMQRPKRNNKDVPINPYEQRRNEQIEINNHMLDALNLPRMNSSGQNVQPSTRTKRIQQPSDAATEGHNLRRSQRNRAENANEQIEEDPEYQPTGDDLCGDEDLHNSPPKKRKRSITKMDNIFARTPNMPKIKITLNEFGQPIGQNYRQFSSAIGVLVRQTLSVGCSDWRLVDIEKKDQVWDTLKGFYDVDEAAKNWFLVTAAKKWKDFKATLKKEFFDEKLTIEELLRKHGNRVKHTDWKFLIKHWTSPEFEDRMEMCKANRAKLRIHHTSGSKSFACSRHEMSVELGRVPRRDEIYIRTHTRKNGVPSQQAEPIINKLKSVAEAHPELTERSIQQGDVFAAACGEKEPRGRVRALGLGPTPQDVGTPGLKCYKSTRLQMEVLARNKSESDKASLERRIQELEEELHEARIVRERRNMEITSQNGSNSRNHVSSRSEEHVDEAHHAQPFEDDVFPDINENSDDYNEDDHFLVPSPTAAPSEPHLNNLSFLSMQRAAALSACAAALSTQHAPALSAQPIAALFAQPAPAPSAQPAPAIATQRAPAPATQRAAAPATQRAAAPSVQRAAAPSTHLAPAPSAKCAPASSVRSVVGGSIDLHWECSATSPIKNVVPSKKNKAPRVSPDDLVGKEVTLYAMLRQEAVAKAVVISTNPSNVLAGQPLGRLFCEVVVKVVIKRDTVLPRPYGDIETLADAMSMPVQWPYKRMKLSNASHSSQPTAGGPAPTRF